MNRLSASLKLVNQLSGGMAALVVVGAVLPLATLSIIGIVTLQRSGYLLGFIILCVVLAAAASVPRLLYRRQWRETQAAIRTTSYVEEDSTWSEKESLLWKQLNTSLEQKLQKDADWGSLKKHSIALALEVAQGYGKKELDFTVPEALQLVEEISRRYRAVLNEMVPGINVVTVSHAKLFYDFSNKYGDTAKSLYQVFSVAWRVGRLANPSAAMMSELRGKFLGSMSDQMLDNLEYNAKRALLQEVAKVCLDLYSGRFVLSSQRNEPAVVSLDPVRIAIVGQVSAGKSSLVNALLKDIKAPTDLLPKTDSSDVYVCQIGEGEELRLIDTPGLDGSKTAVTNAFNEVINADVVVWVLRANQPSRELDNELQQKLNAYYSNKENISKKSPRIIAVLNQVDKLKPVGEWAPPYDVAGGESPKEKIIREAMAYNSSTLTVVDEVHALAIPEGKACFGLSELEAEIEQGYENAINVQLNRRRHEGNKGEGAFTREVKRVFKLGKEAAKNIL